VVEGSVRIAGGRVAAVAAGPCAVAGAVDFAGDLLLPGLIELHTDNLEKQLEPRPGVFWPAPVASVVAHDTQMTAAGITTVLDAVSLGEYHDGPKRAKMMALSIEAIGRARAGGVLRADHFLHLRCEYPDPKVLEMLAPHLCDEHLRLVSLMDHTPGQRQFTDLAAYRTYYSKHAWTDQEFETLARDLRAQQAACAAANRERILAWCARASIPVASHDDTRPEHVDAAAREGVAICEFPTTLAAARRAREKSMAIVMGAPNVVRDGSHSGNVAALDLAAEGLLDILSSDYVPASLLHAAFRLHQELEIPLPDAVATVSRNPARAVGLTDRGEIAPGLRADLIRVRRVEGLPVVLETLCAGPGLGAGARAA
jgi:alpha-D-ribose 1-methylphosphonate 5-triphosphate diphosphatase